MSETATPAVATKSTGGRRPTQATIDARKEATEQADRAASAEQRIGLLEDVIREIEADKAALVDAATAAAPEPDPAPDVKSTLVLTPPEAQADSQSIYLADADLVFEPLDVPTFADERFALYAVRLDTKHAEAEGYWPAKLVDRRTTLCAPESHRKRIVPMIDPANRKPRAAYEQPVKNEVVQVNTPEGFRMMYLADAMLRGWPVGGTVSVQRRAWQRLDASDRWYFEDPRAAAMTSDKAVAAVVGWCPFKAVDDHGYPADHGRVFGVGEPIPGTPRAGDGWCQACKRQGVEQQKQALSKVRALLGAGSL